MIPVSGSSPIMRILRRIGNIIEGLVFIILSLCWQSFFAVLLAMAVLTGLSAIGVPTENKALGWAIWAVLVVIVNALACWEYFRKQRAQVRLGSKSSIIFMFPRALDLIWNGSERISR